MIQKRYKRHDDRKDGGGNLEKRQTVGTILLAMIIPAIVVGALSADVPDDLLSKALSVLIVAVISGAIAAILCFILMRRKSA